MYELPRFTVQRYGKTASPGWNRWVYSLQHRDKTIILYRGSEEKRGAYKCDLVKEREVKFASGKNYANENGLLVIGTSAKEVTNQLLVTCQLEGILNLSIRSS